MVSLPQANYLAGKTSLLYKDRWIKKYLSQFTFQGNRFINKQLHCSAVMCGYMMWEKFRIWS